MSSDGARFTGSNTIVTSSGETEDVGIVTGTRAGDDTLSVSERPKVWSRCLQT